MTENVLFSIIPRRSAITSRDVLPPIFAAECQAFDRTRLRRIIDIAYDGLLHDRTDEALNAIAEFFALSDDSDSVLIAQGNRATKPTLPGVGFGMPPCEA